MPSSDHVVQFTVDGRQVEVPDVGDTLLGVLRDHLGLTSVKDGCSPQGQCGCCTVLVDGQPRVACVTPARRVKGRTITTVDGLTDGRADRWAEAFCATGGSQCGFCTPGIIVRLDGLQAKLSANAGPAVDPSAEKAAVKQALLAHLCRCTGWQTILEAWDHFAAGDSTPPARDLVAASERAAIEGGASQSVSPEVALGRGGFAADTAPADALIAVPVWSQDGAVSWEIGETLQQARANAGKVQGRRTTAEHTWPLEVPDGDWAAVLRTTWTEPAFLETDAAWCEPGGVPSSPLANGGAFGAKLTSPVQDAARALADEHQRPVLALASREDSVRWGPKRPPIAAGIRPDGTGVVRVVKTDGIADIITDYAPGLIVEEVEVSGPDTDAGLRGAGWVEAAVLTSALSPGPVTVVSPTGATATVALVEGTITVDVDGGSPLDEVMLRSYCIGAAHMGWSWATSEALTIDEAGEIHDLTVRSFGVLRAVDMPEVQITIAASDAPPVNASDAVFAAVAAVAWRERGLPREWPTG